MKAFILAASILLLSFVNVSWAQFNNGRVLDPPNPQLCAQRIIHERTPDGKGYFFSWRDPALKGVEEDWLTARNYCRRRCMDSVSLETSLENEWVKQRVVNENVLFQKRNIDIMMEDK
uniref:C-type lectin domain-containing protein n=1 Tax=Glossina austeni TaxID=7395 RepID=A0A1A9V8I6_GLOAU